MAAYRNTPIPRLAAATALVLLTGCAARDPVLPPYLLGPSSVPLAGPVAREQPPAATPASVPSAVAPAPVAAALPNITYLDDRLVLPARRLPGAAVNARGSVHAVVFPIALGDREPTWSEQEIAAHLFGEDDFASHLYRLSGGALKVAGDIFPALVDGQMHERDIIQSVHAERNLRTFAGNVVTEWSRRANLASYDNDGPDGRPMSGDDDGQIDLIYILIETAGFPALMRVPLGLDLPVGRTGRLTVRAREAYIMTLPPRGVDAPPSLGADVRLNQFFAMAGVNPHVAMFPREHGAEMSSYARAELGWSPSLTLTETGLFGLRTDGVVMVPSGTRNGPFWLIERRNGYVWVSEMARRGGEVEIAHVERLAQGSPPSALSLGRYGRMVRSVVIEWEEGAREVRIDVKESEPRR
jgi:hypothetical protein